MKNIVFDLGGVLFARDVAKCTQEFVDFIRKNWNPADLEATVAKFVKESGIFTVDFSEVPGFVPAVAAYLADIRGLGMAKALDKFLSK